MLELLRGLWTGWIEQALALVIVAMRDQQAGATPVLDGGGGDGEALGNLGLGEQPAGPQPGVTCGQGIGRAQTGDRGRVKLPALASREALAIELLGRLGIGVVVQQDVDRLHHAGGGLPPQPRWLGQRKLERMGHATVETHLGGELRCLQ